MLSDKQLLDWLADHDIIEGFTGVREDIHDIASEMAGEAPITKEITRAALRQLIYKAARAAPAGSEESEAAAEDTFTQHYRLDELDHAQASSEESEAR